MNIKLRFALLFTSFVAIILLTSATAIYLLYASYRSEDYYNRVNFEANEVYRIFNEIRKPDRQVTADLVKDVHDKALYNEELFIEDSLGNILFKMPDTARNTISVSRPMVIKKKEYEFTDEQDVQHVVLYKSETGMFVHASGYDRSGFSKQRTLKLILLVVFFGGLLLTAVMSFLFVQQAIKPIVRLSLQMQRTNEQNLSDRIEVKPANDEINAIARNFNAMLERLRKAFESQKSFVQHASHELRTPLAVMLSQTESALNRTCTEDEYRLILESLKEEQQHMVQLTNSLLVISQYESLEYLADWPFIRIDELLYETIAMSKRMYPGIRISFSFEHPPRNDQELMVRGNDTLLRSAFMNLIKNAFKYSVDQSVNIVLETGADHVRISIENRGPQLTMAEVEKMMIPFFRGENAANKKGFGLGLSIIDRIVSLHKGKVAYEPAGKDLNIFSVTLKTQVQ
ncbi:MAG TPA: HAMP domain-containing sensor histidine kinase [Sediminibacterium sp.]|nr:HAMP domain-containing sensor histidine kinase [Sediminibacterium sp.]